MCDWETKPDDQYYFIPDGFHCCSDAHKMSQLSGILARGLKRYFYDVDCHLQSCVECKNAEAANPNSKSNTAFDVLDRWLEHDSLRENYFDYLIPEEETDDFFQKCFNLSQV